MGRRFITEALDSKLIKPDNYLSTDVDSHINRLRLNSIAATLFGNTLIIPQGWSIDSLPLFCILHEFTTAVKNIASKGERTSHDVLTLSPFVREFHVDEPSYFGLLKLYLDRDECIWSGLPLFQDKLTRQEFAAQLSLSSAAVNFDQDNFISFAQSALSKTGGKSQSEQIALHWSSAVKYFCSQESITRSTSNGEFKGRSIKANMSSQSYIGNVRLALEKATINIGSSNQPLIAELKLFEESLRKYPGTQPTSLVLHLAEQFGPEITEAVSHISTFSQIRAAATPTLAEQSAPALSKDSSDARKLGNALLVKAFSDGKPPQGITVRSSFPRKFDEQLNTTTNWIPIWERVISLSQNLRWKSQIRKIEASMADGRPLMAEIHFTKLQNILAEHCPEITFKQSMAGKIGLQISSKLEKFLSVGLLPGIATIATDSHVLPNIEHFISEIDILPHHMVEIAGLGLLMAGREFLRKNEDNYVNPFTEHTASIFELTHNRAIET